MSPNSADIRDEFLAQLKKDLVCRRVGRGLARLEEYGDHLRLFSPEQRNAALFASYLAQWVDVGFQRPAVAKEVVSKFTPAIRTRLPLRDYLHLRMAEGMV